jgi:hypothetical protein
MAKKNFAAKAERRAARTIANRDAAEKKNASEAQNVVDFPTTTGVSSPGSVGTVSVAPSATFEGRRKMELHRINPDRKGSSIVYSFGDGVRGTVKFARSIFGDTVPETLPVPEWPVVQGSKPKAKLTKEERAALKAAETPQMKLAAAKERARKAQERAAKLEASLASA